jgi:hypothetical protein
MNLIPQPDDTLAERLAKLRAAWVYKRALGVVGRDPLTPGERVRTQTVMIGKINRARDWLLPKPAPLPANVIRLRRR